ncbi:hypothetical protein H0H93_005733 [Arthromyces matolae]|nr:hypothetical protein H0H93_005733 [Arthromyces matolae]
MAKKSLNPADAYRKAQRKKELKKNKVERTKARDLAIVKKDTYDLEDEIQKLEATKNPSEQERLAELKTELEKINRKKAEYVAEHPEHRRLVYRPRRKDDDAVQEEIVLPKRRIFDKNGLPRHPERSIYYDPVMNPFGVAPPGMQYMERAPLPGEVWTDEESSGDGEVTSSEDDIAMPAGPPPGDKEEDFDVDDIEMPDGPPPDEQGNIHTLLPPLPGGPPPLPSITPPSVFPFVPPPLPSGPIPTLAPPFPPGFPHSLSVPPPLPSGPTSTIAPPPPPGFPPVGFSVPPHTSFGYPLPPPPPGFPSGSSFSQHIPPPPPGFFPRRNEPSIQEYSSVPAAQSPATHTNHPPVVSHTLPMTKPATSKVQGVSAAATVSAEPQLRDFKKEATAFVPTALKRKKPATASSSRVNAAPSAEDETPEHSGPSRPDLVSTLMNKFGAPPSASGSSTVPTTKPEKKKDDYDKFMEDMGDILGPRSGKLLLLPLLASTSSLKALPSEIWSEIVAYVLLVQGTNGAGKLLREIALPLVYATVDLATILSLQRFQKQLHLAEQKWDSIRRIPYSTPGRWVQSLNLSELTCTGPAEAFQIDSLLTSLFPLVPFLAHLSLNHSVTLSRWAIASLGDRAEAVNIRSLQGINYKPSNSWQNDPFIGLLRNCVNLIELEMVWQGFEPVEMDTDGGDLPPNSFQALHLPKLKTLSLLSMFNSPLMMAMLFSPLPCLRKLMLTPHDDIQYPVSLVSRFIQVHGKELQSLLLVTPKTLLTRLHPSPSTLLETSPHLRHLSLENPVPPLILTTRSHPLQIISIPRPNPDLWQTLQAILPRLPELRIIRSRDVRWLRTGMNSIAQLAGVQGEMREWSKRLSRRGIRFLDADWSEAKF